MATDAQPLTATDNAFVAFAGQPATDSHELRVRSDETENRVRPRARAGSSRLDAATLPAPASRLVSDGVASGEFSFREARQILGDLFEHKPWIYWTDLILTTALGYGGAMVYLRSPAFSLIQIVGFLVSGFALFRVGSFIHEITHLRKGELLAFRVGWNLLCGIPMLMPSFFYE